MKKTFVSVGGDPLGEQRLVGKVRAGIAARRADDAEYASQWEQTICNRPSSMSHFEYARFILWHRQFRGMTTPGVPLVVGAARRLLKPALDLLPALTRLWRRPA